MITRLEDFKVYNFAMELGEEVWQVVTEWNYFEKQSVGIQLVKAADSIAANLSEGLRRYHFKEAKNFGYFSRGSLFETKTWVTKAHRRKLLSEDRFLKLVNDIEMIGKMLNSYIKSIGTVSEPLEVYKTTVNHLNTDSENDVH